MPELVAERHIDQAAADAAAEVFEKGGEGAFVCDSDSETDNICVNCLPEKGYVLVQTFPKKVTQGMIRRENLVGIQLEAMLIGLFLLYIGFLVFRAGRDRKALEKENREMGYIISGVNTLFSRFTLVDFETGRYQYLAGTRPEDGGIPVEGDYEQLRNYLSGTMVEEEKRGEFAELIREEAIEEALAGQDDLRYECHLSRGGHVEWAHMNIICLERVEGRATKVLFIRQNITDLKERELRAQAEISLANRKERQYRIAITSNAIATFDFNLTKDWIENDIFRIVDGEKVSMLKRVGLEAPGMVRAVEGAH